MDYIKRLKKLKLRKKRRDILLLVWHYRRSGLGTRTNQQIRNDIAKRLNRKEYLTIIDFRNTILGELSTSSKRFRDILERL